jgi:acyl-CoA synthetase (AMP-forming)/AMP-acid ligase II
MWELIERRAEASPDAVMVVDESARSITFGEYRAEAEQAAAGLLHTGVGETVNVSWQLPTWTESMVLVGALARLGAVQNPLLPIYRAREVGFSAKQTTARLLVVPDEWRGFDYKAMAGEIADGLDGLEVVVATPDLPRADPASLPPPPPTPDDPVDLPVRWLFYTSESTDPKGARHTDASLIAAAAGMCSVVEIEENDISALVIPLAHIWGIVWLHAALLTGCRLVAVAAFDPPTTIPILRREEVTLVGAGTPFYKAYLAEQRKDTSAPLFPRVRAFPGGAARKPPRLHHDLKAAVGSVGILSSYGLIECPIVSMSGVHDPDEKLAGGEGRPTSGVIMRIVSPDGVDVGAGEEGEIWVKGPQLFRGYVDASLDAGAFDDRGFFGTGDLGRLDDDGFLTVTGRLKDVIIRKGQNISAKEIEDLLSMHPKVADVAVIGVPDPTTGERACAVVASNDPSDPLTFEEMVSFLQDEQLMAQKIPEQLEGVDGVPRDPDGTILKDNLRDRLAGLA